MEAVCSSETMVTFYWTTCYHIPKDSTTIPQFKLPILIDSRYTGKTTCQETYVLPQLSFFLITDKYWHLPFYIKKCCMYGYCYREAYSYWLLEHWVQYPCSHLSPYWLSSLQNNKDHRQLGWDAWLGHWRHLCEFYHDLNKRKSFSKYNELI